MKLINLFFLLFLIILFYSCDKTTDLTSNASVKGCRQPNSFNYNPAATEDDGSCKEMEGCLGYSSGLTNSGSLGNTLNSAYYDQKMSEEIYLQSIFFNGIPATVYILYEPSIEMKNAYASPEGNILFGYYMFYYTIQSYGELPVSGILAHEWGHRTQFTVGWQDYYKPSHKELEADAFSGFYMALAKQYAWDQIESYYANVYATGDYYYNSPTHHGTPDQRLNAAYLGVNTAIYALQSGKQYTYSELHEIFFGTIRTQIDGKSQGHGFKDVVYPKNLNKDYIKSLFPKM